MVNPPIEKTGTLPAALSRTESRAVKSLTRRSRQRYLAIRGIHSLSVRLTRSVPSHSMPAAAIDLMTPSVHPFDDH